METLRNEIIESQKARNDLLKWKLLLVSGLGAAGLGFSQHTGAFKDELVLCCIPFVCAYVDLVCHHLYLRILVIGKFISLIPAKKGTRSCIGQYEIFVDTNFRNPDKRRRKKIGAFDLEDWALVGSSIILSLALIVYSLWSTVEPKRPFIISGSLGILASIAIHFFARHRANKIAALNKADLSLPPGTEDCND